jgi:hypothetical protein
MKTRLLRSIALAASLILPLGLLAVTPEEGRQAADKLDRISRSEMSPGEQVTLTESELNSFLRYDYAPLIPEGIENLQVGLHQDLAVVSGKADFSKLSPAADMATRLLLMMFRGEHAFVARVRYVSSAGQARADVDSLLVDGQELKGVILDWIVKNYVATDLSGFALGQPTPLGNNLEQILLQPGQAIVTATSTQAQR